MTHMKTKTWGNVDIHPSLSVTFIAHQRYIQIYITYTYNHTFTQLNGCSEFFVQIQYNVSVS